MNLGGEEQRDCAGDAMGEGKSETGGDNPRGKGGEAGISCGELVLLLE